MEVRRNERLKKERKTSYRKMVEIKLKEWKNDKKKEKKEIAQEKWKHLKK